MRFDDWFHKELVFCESELQFIKHELGGVRATDAIRLKLLAQRTIAARERFRHVNQRLATSANRASLARKYEFLISSIARKVSVIEQMVRVQLVRPKITVREVADSMKLVLDIIDVVKRVLALLGVPAPN